MTATNERPGAPAVSALGKAEAPENIIRVIRELLEQMQGCAANHYPDADYSEFSTPPLWTDAEAIISALSAPSPAATVAEGLVSALGKAHTIEFHNRDGWRELTFHFERDEDLQAAHDAWTDSSSPAPSGPADARVRELEGLVRELRSRFTGLVYQPAINELLARVDAAMAGVET